MLTPTISKSSNAMRKQFKCNLDVLIEESNLHFHKLANTAMKMFADYAILFDENSTIFKQNNKKTIREASKRNVASSAKAMSEEEAR